VRFVLALKSSKEQRVFRTIGYKALEEFDPWFENADVHTLVIM